MRRVQGIDREARVRGPLFHPSRLLFGIGCALTILYIILFVHPFLLTQLSPETPRDGEPFVQYLGAYLPYTWLGHAFGLVIIFLLYIIGWKICFRSSDPRLIHITILFSIIFGALFTITSPVMTVDIIDYAFRAKMIVRYGLNPLVASPTDVPIGDTWLNLLHWTDIPTPYGPLWLALSSLAYMVAGDNLLENVYLLKFIAFAAYLACVSLIFWMTRHRVPGQGAGGLCLFAWNPLVLIELIGNGHNDIVMILAILLAFASAYHRKWHFLYPALAAAFLIKVTAILFAPFFSIYAVISLIKCRSRVDNRRFILGAFLAIGMICLLYGLFWAGPDTIKHVSRAQLGTTINSPATAFLVFSKFSGFSVENRVAVVMAIAYGLFIGVYLALLIFMGCNKLTLAESCHDGIALFLFTAATWFWPWYLSWLLVPASLVSSYRRQVGAIVFSLTSLSYYFVKALGLTQEQFSIALVVIFAVPLSCYALAILRFEPGWPTLPRGSMQAQVESR